jgi:beta-phosphoglucomutase-like phosphatase (HAD superfamily)
MTKAPFPSDQQDKFMLRMPDGMRERIKAAADANGRSMNSEIVATLEAKYPAREQLIETLLQTLERLRELEGRGIKFAVGGRNASVDEFAETVAEEIVAARKASEAKEQP